MRFDFKAMVSPQGYTFRGGRLVPVEPYPFPPHEHPELFRRLRSSGSTLFVDFAKLPQERSDIIAFANEYGELDRTDRYFVAKDGTEGNTFNFWQRQIQVMASTVRIWRSLQDGDEDYFRELARDCRAHQRTFEPMPESLLPIATVAALSRQRKTAREGKKVPPRNIALGLLQWRFLCHVPEGSTCVQVSYDNRTDRLEPIVFAHSLLSALWCQFADAVGTSKPIANCKSCGRAIDISDTGSRIDREYCSDACRQRESRKIRRRAREMRQNGKSLRSIAKEFGVDTERVKKWVGE